MTDLFTRDHAAGSALASQFGAGAGTAEQLIEANALRYSPELTAASSLEKDPEATRDLDREEVAGLVGVEPKHLLDVAVRGPYVSYVAEDEQGRVFKGVLGYDDGVLESIEPDDDPRRERLRAAAKAASQVADAQSEAEKIVADAKREAEKIVADAAAKAAEDERKANEKAADAAADGSGDTGNTAQTASAETPAKPASRGRSTGTTSK